LCFGEVAAGLRIISGEKDLAVASMTWKTACQSKPNGIAHLGHSYANARPFDMACSLQKLFADTALHSGNIGSSPTFESKDMTT